MKSLRITLLVLFSTLTLGSSSFAIGTPGDINEELKEKIVKLIDRPDLTNVDGYKFQAEIEFIVTRQNQILVLAVYTDNLFFDEYIKERLNYKNINLKGVQRLTPYRLNVNFVKSLKEKVRN